ncbi:MAG: DUF2007 domain-containing protein [Myxococcales bacterium]
MKLCPNPDCRYRTRHGKAAEYQDSAVNCSDCGTALVDAPAPAPPADGETKPTRQRGPTGPRPWARLAITLVCCVLVVAGTLIPLPGTWELQQSLRQSGGLLSLFNLRASAAQLSLLALGVNPIVSAFGLVELVAVLVPRLRPLRIGGFEGRAVLRRWVIGLAALFAFIQSVGIAIYERDLGQRMGGYSFSVSLEPWVPWATVLLLPLGTLAFAVLAEIVNRWGLGNGFSCLILASLSTSLADAAVQTLFQARSSTASAGSLLVLVFFVVGAVTLGALALLRRGPFRVEPRPFALELPLSGLDPIGFAGSVALLPATVAASLGLRLNERAFDVLGSGVVNLVLVGSLGVALSILYSQPRRVARLWLGRTPSEAELGTVWGQVAAAAVRGTVLLLALRALPLLLELVNVPVRIELTFVLVPTAILLDLGAEWSFRRRHPRLLAAYPVHRVYAVQPALKALEDAGIPTFPRGLHHRTLLQLFGPYVPVSLLVPEEKVEEAARIVEKRLAEPEG